MQVYVAGPLFNQAEVAQRKLEGKILRQRFPNLTIFNPIDQPFNEDKSSLPSPIEIYEKDTQAVLESQIFICDLTNEDSGVATELGLAIANKCPIIIGINSDIRLKAANKYDIPSYGMNHYVLGGILKHGHLVYSFEEACDLLENLLKD